MFVPSRQTSKTLFETCNELNCWALNEAGKMNVRFFFSDAKIYLTLWKAKTCNVKFLW